MKFLNDRYTFKLINSFLYYYEKMFKKTIINAINADFILHQTQIEFMKDVYGNSQSPLHK